jgi:hypothetical protein
MRRKGDLRSWHVAWDKECVGDTYPDLGKTFGCKFYVEAMFGEIVPNCFHITTFSFKAFTGKPN